MAQQARTFVNHLGTHFHAAPTSQSMTVAKRNSIAGTGVGHAIAAPIASMPAIASPPAHRLTSAHGMTGTGAFGTQVPSGSSY